MRARSSLENHDMAKRDSGEASVAWAFVTFGILLRVVRYLMDFPFWSDEARLAANFVHDDFDAIWQPLRYQQVAPLGFLTVEMASVRLLGFSTWSLRLFALACSVASVPLFHHVARRLLEGWAFVLAVAFFSAAWWPVKFGSEVKPYASDLFASLALLAIAVEWLRAPGRAGWLWVLAVSAVLAVTLSFPSVFVIGGLILALAPTVLRSRRVRVVIPFLLVAIVPAVLFALLLPIYHLSPQVQEYMERYWADAYPPRGGVIRLLAWLIQVHVGTLFAYPIGCESGGSIVTAAGFFTGSYVLWKRREHSLLVLGLAPLAINLAAASIHRYPYGDQVRTMQYAVPVICLFAGLGLPVLIDAIPGPRWPRRASGGLFYGSIAVGVVQLIFVWIHPYELKRDLRLRDFARRFWSETSRDAGVACAECHFGLAVWPRQWEVGNWTNYFECYERIYSPCCRAPEAAPFGPPVGPTPLRVVFFNERPEDSRASRDWFRDMRRTCDVRLVRAFTLRLPERRAADMVSRYLVYEFRARASNKVAQKNPDVLAYIGRTSTRHSFRPLWPRTPAPHEPIPQGAAACAEARLAAYGAWTRRRHLTHQPGRDPWEQCAAA